MQKSKGHSNAREGTYNDIITAEKEPVDLQLDFGI